MSNEIVWFDLRAKLARPFDPSDVDFRPQMGKNDGPGARVQAVCYIDARVVADRLDEVVGPGEWSFHYEPLVIERGEIQLAKGALTIHGVTKEDVGDGSTFATSKGCVSDALKRAAVLWGIGRYLYSQPTEWVTLDQYKRIPENVIAQLRAKLPRPDGAQPVTLSELQEAVRHTPARGGGNPPAQPPFVARPPVIHPPADEPAAAAAQTPKREPKLETLADVQQALASYRRELHINDKAIIATDQSLDYQASLARRSEYVEAWKRATVERQKAGAR